MATTVAQHPVTAFTSPTNGTSPIDADEVVANDSAIRTAYNAHDADTGIHVQSSVFGSRPAAGTSGRKFITVDQLSAPTQIRSFYDDGTNWYEHNYFGSATTIAAALTVSSGGIAVTGNSTITGTLGGLTGLTVASGGITVTGASSITGNTTVTGTLAVTSTINSQTISSSANFTGSVTVANGLIVTTGGASLGGGASIGGSTTLTSGDLTVSAGKATIAAGSTTNALTVTTTGAIQGSFRYDSSNRLDTKVSSAGIVTFEAVGASAAFSFNAGITVNGNTTQNGTHYVTSVSSVQQAIRYDSSNRLDVSVSSDGQVTFDAVGASAAVTFSDPVRVNAAGGLALAVSSSTKLLVLPNDSGSSAAGKTMEYRTDGTGADSRAHTFLVNNGNFAAEFSPSTTADDTFLLVFDYTGAQMKRVVRGAADSGGTGFRMLRIAN